MSVADQTEVFSRDVCNLLAGAPEAVLFDLDGTLVDSVPDLAAAVDQMLLSLGREPAGEEKVRRWVGNGAAALIRRALADHDDDAQWTDESMFDQANAEFGLAYTRQLTQATGFYPGVKEVLDNLHGTEIRMALITNKPRQFTIPLLSSLGISDYFSCVICGDDLEQRKPHPEPILFALKKLGVASESALMVGDSVSDIVAAKAAGVLTVAVTYGYNHGSPVEEEKGERRADLFIDHMPALVSEN